METDRSFVGGVADLLKEKEEGGAGIEGDGVGVVREEDPPDFFLYIADRVYLPDRIAKLKAAIQIWGRRWRSVQMGLMRTRNYEAFSEEKKC